MKLNGSSGVIGRGLKARVEVEEGGCAGMSGDTGGAGAGERGGGQKYGRMEPARTVWAPAQSPPPPKPPRT